MIVTFSLHFKLRKACLKHSGFVFQQFTDKLENMLETLTSTEEQVTNAGPVSAHPDKIREQIAENNVS